MQRRFGVFELKIAGLGPRPGSGEGGGRAKVPLGHPGGGWVVCWGGGGQGVDSGGETGTHGEITVWVVG